jgi:predicted nucleotide-binding protein
MDAVMLRADLLAMRRTVEIAADNLRRAFGLFGPGSAGEPEAIPGSLFADDAALARSLGERLDDEAGYLAIAADRAEKLGAQFAPEAWSATTVRSTAEARPIRLPSAGSAVTVTAGPDTERRNVFVVYGRDHEARRAVFDFLRSLGLRPLEWEELVQATGKMAPFLCETVRTGLEMATAVVVLLTPEDVVRLHPDLHEPGDNLSETCDALQARPNVLLELGMALAAKPDATLILIAGEHRTVTDLGGMSYVTLSGDPDCRTRIANRLRVAGCAVSPVGTDWLTAGNFAGMAAQYRAPSASLP